MKKTFALILALSLCLCLAACVSGNDTSKADESKSVSSTAGTSSAAESASKQDDSYSSVASSDISSAAEDSSADSSSAAESSEAVSSQESSADASSAAEASSEDASSGQNESSEDKPAEIPTFISNFVSYAPIATNLTATDTTSIRLTKVNDDAGYGDISLYTYDYLLDNAKIKYGSFSDYAIMVAEYDHDFFGCVKTEFYAVGEYNEAVGPEIPDDGFVIIAHKTQPDMIGRLTKLDEETTLYVAGVQVCDVNYSISETETPITIDGIIDKEWEDYKIDTIDENNEKWTYSKFESDNYYTTAEYYVTYDKDYLYLGVLVNSPFHYCPADQVSPASPNGMWKYECIQVKFCSVSPKSEYIMEHYNHHADATANNDGTVRAYAFTVNDNDVVCYYENSPLSKVFQGKCVCSRNDMSQETVYEVAIPWSEYGIDPMTQETIGLTFSINSTNEDDIGNGTFRNLILRDGGGVIGRNDWAKIPEVTLEHND